MPSTDFSPAAAAPAPAANLRHALLPYLQAGADVDWSDAELPAAPIRRESPGLAANSAYFGHPLWGEAYLKHCHRNDAFRRRWAAAAGPWDGKIVVDIGCGPGNIYATLGGKPRLLIGVDASAGGLRMARRAGYLPLLADAQDLPLADGFADLVVLNATLHHCDDMPRVLAEAARLVAPGGWLVTDHDPQLTAWAFRGPVKWAWDFRLKLYRWLRKGFHASVEEQKVGLATEVHHQPGDGVTVTLFHEVLPALGFAVEVYPHNHDLGEEVLAGRIGRSGLKYRLAQYCSGLDPDAPASALSLLCRARRTRQPAAGAGCDGLSITTA